MFLAFLKRLQVGSTEKQTGRQKGCGLKHRLKKQKVKALNLTTPYHVGEQPSS
jgi:hypothetical protein